MRKLTPVMYMAAACLSLNCLAQSLADHERADPRIAVQMYTLRDVGSLDEQMFMARSTGFEAVELVSGHGTDAVTLKETLDRYGLQVMASHEQLTELEASPDTVIGFHQQIGNKVLIVPYLQPDERPMDRTGWQALGRRLDRLGAYLRGQGMQLGYHNHDFEMKQYGRKTAYEWMIDSTAPENVTLEIDVAWVFRGGQDPSRLLKKYAERIYSIHVKDATGVGVRDDERNFAPLGEGLLDWERILPTAWKARTAWYVIEHDLPQDPAGIITTGRENLSRYLLGWHP